MIANRNTLYDRALILVEKYGIFLALASAYGVLTPDLSPRTDLDGLREANAHASASSNILKQLIWTGLFVAFFICMTRATVSSKPLKKKWALILIPIVSTTLLLASVLWSDAKVFTVKRGIFQFFLIFDIFCGVYFSSKHETIGRNVRILGVMIILFTVITIVTGSGFSEIGLASYMPHKNSFGAILLSFFAIYLCLKPIWRDIYIVPILVLFLILSLSKTSIALFIAMIALYFLNTIFSSFVFSSIYYFTCCIFLVIPMTASFFGILWYPAQDKSPEFMTGRGLVWQTLYPEALKKSEMAVGHGYGAFFGTGKIPTALDVDDPFLPHLNQSHNSYLDLSLQLGFPITIVLVTLIFTLVRRINVKQLYLTGSVLLVYGVSEGAIFRDQQGVWITFLTVLSWSLLKISDTQNKSCLN